ncbi:hypothetical protein A3F56_03090 [Candidatus Kaiserbacteria bacterium RIFCSPHIGHO2_12_FULL_55_13]|nr:MAG: hypothetical protein A3F56_03090 [Candidatus Kaiserbacteria bacterium RIFCSPHIGHO2_12_FULL_55_13]
MAHNYAIYPKLFELDSIDQLEWRFPAYTIGEAASATILGPDPANGWAFFNRTRNDLYDLCTVPNPWSNPRSARVAKDGLSHFTSYGIDLRKHGFPGAVETFRESGIDTSKVDVLFTHSSSKADWSAGAKLLGMHNKMYDIYSKFGNVVSGAIPVAMASAEREGTLKRGMNVAAWVASAGMSFSTAEFVY